ncbi:MAG: hypothetical protein AAF992_02805 [Bacteroidota bacterium]
MVSQATYFLLALVLWVAGYLHTGRFVRPRWKQAGKLLFYLGVSALLIYWIGPYSLIFIIGHPLIGLIFHIRVCNQHGINWRSCQPREKYIALQEKWARGDFK